MWFIYWSANKKTFIRESINLKVSPGVIQCQNEYKKFFCSIHNCFFFFFFFQNVSYV